MLTIGYHRAGPDLHEQVETVDLIPFGISTGTAPVLHGESSPSGAGQQQPFSSLQQDLVPYSIS